MHAGASMVSVHAEASLHLHRAVHVIKQLGAKAGVVLNPATPASALEAIATDLDQTDIRRMLDRAFTGRAPERPQSRLIDTRTEATAHMAAIKMGALIAIRGREPWPSQIHGGIELGGTVSAPLLYGIFNPDTPGHDGAVLIEDDRLTRFAVHLPLAEELPEVSRYGGTRHAAALGLSQECDPSVLSVELQPTRTVRVPVVIPTIGVLPHPLELVGVRAEPEAVNLIVPQGTAGPDQVPTEVLDLRQISGDSEIRVLLRSHLIRIWRRMKLQKLRSGSTFAYESSPSGTCVARFRASEDSCACEDHTETRSSGQACRESPDDAGGSVRPRGDTSRTRGEARGSIDEAGDRHRPVEGATRRRKTAASTSDRESQDQAERGVREPRRRTWGSTAVAPAISRDQRRVEA